MAWGVAGSSSSFLISSSLSSECWGIQKTFRIRNTKKSFSWERQKETLLTIERNGSVLKKYNDVKNWSVLVKNDIQSGLVSIGNGKRKKIKKTSLGYVRTRAEDNIIRRKWEHRFRWNWNNVKNNNLKTLNWQKCGSCENQVWNKWNINIQKKIKIEMRIMQSTFKV
jgi:hypothetical protein